MSYGGGQKVQKVMVQPINLIFRYLQNRTRVVVWLYENVNTRIEGQIVGKKIISQHFIFLGTLVCTIFWQGDLDHENLQEKYSYSNFVQYPNFMKVVQPIQTFGVS